MKTFHIKTQITQNETFEVRAADREKAELLIDSDLFCNGRVKVYPQKRHILKVYEYDPVYAALERTILENPNDPIAVGLKSFAQSIVRSHKDSYAFGDSPAVEMAKKCLKAFDEKYPNQKNG